MFYHMSPFLFRQNGVKSPEEGNLDIQIQPIWTVTAAQAAKWCQAPVIGTSYSKAQIACLDNVSPGGFSFNAILTSPTIS